MGYTDIEESLYKPPYWMQSYTNLVHCKYCDAVYTKGTKFVKVESRTNGTNLPTFRYIRDCKQDVCPMCEK